MSLLLRQGVPIQISTNSTVATWIWHEQTNTQKGKEADACNSGYAMMMLTFKLFWQHRLRRTAATPQVGRGLSAAARAPRYKYHHP